MAIMLGAGTLLSGNTLNAQQKKEVAQEMDVLLV
jgi:hypothetical protein